MLNPCLKPNTPLGWLLIAREFTFPAGWTSSWAKPLDVLALDAEGTPTLIEAKIGYNNTTRREVVGQMVDYLGAAVLQDPSAHIRAALKKRCQSHGLTPEAAIEAAFGGRLTPSDLWAGLASAVTARRLRMVFALDRVPGELARAVHALDLVMQTANFHALEVTKRRSPGGSRYASDLIGVERWHMPAAPTIRAHGAAKDWEPLAVIERDAGTVRVENRTRLVPLPKTFRLEASSTCGKRDQHQVDPSRPESHIAVMPNLDLLKSTQNPYPAMVPHPTVRCRGASYLPWVHIAYVTWERLRTGDVIHPAHVQSLLDAAAEREPALLKDKVFVMHGGQGVLDALRDLQLYGLCSAFRRGQAWRFVRNN